MARFEPKTWRYLFMRRRPGQTDGPHHGEEVAHVFGDVRAAPPGETADLDETGEAVSATMMTAWVSFVRCGDLNGGPAPGSPVAASMHWPAYDPASDNYACFADAQTQAEQWRQPQLDFLDRFYAKAG